MKRILFQGDSITDAGRSRNNIYSTEGAGHGYPLLVRARLQCDFPGEYEVINLGVSGDRVVDVYARLGRDIVNLKPDVLSILLGINDVWHGLSDNPNGVDAVKYERVYDWLLTEVKAALPETKIMILEPFVLPASATYREGEAEPWATFSQQVPLRAQAAKRVAEKHGAAFVPLQAALDEACSGNDPSLWLGDGVHPTAAGHELIAREWVKAFEKLN